MYSNNHENILMSTTIFYGLELVLFHELFAKYSYYWKSGRKGAICDMDLYSLQFWLESQKKLAYQTKIWQNVLHCLLKSLWRKMSRGHRDLLDSRLRGQLVTIWKTKFFEKFFSLPSRSSRCPQLRGRLFLHRKGDM